MFPYISYTFTQVVLFCLPQNIRRVNKKIVYSPKKAKILQDKKVGARAYN